MTDSEAASATAGPSRAGSAPDAAAAAESSGEGRDPSGDPSGEGQDPPGTAEAASPPEPSSGAVPDVAAEAPDGPAAQPAQDPLQALAAERDQYLDDLRRVSAEFANFRRQAAKRSAEVSAQAGARIAEALLVVFDACEAADRQGVEGAAEIAGQLTAVLTREGLEVIHDDGAPFDPARHEATMSESAEADNADDGTGPAQAGPVVAETLRTGYAWNGRVLRAAMVKVKG